MPRPYSPRICELSCCCVLACRHGDFLVLRVHLGLRFISCVFLFYFGGFVLKFGEDEEG